MWLTCISRTVFVALIFTQTGILTSAYWGPYNNSLPPLIGGIVSILMLIAMFFIWVMIIYRSEEQLSNLWIVWTMYAIGFVVIIFCTQGRWKDELDKNHFWGPNNLKITICMTPIVALNADCNRKRC